MLFHVEFIFTENVCPKEQRHSMSKAKREQFDMEAFHSSEKRSVKKTSKYTILLIPDSTDHSRSFELTFDRVVRIIAAITAFCIILVSLMVSVAIRNYRLTHDNSNLLKIAELNEEIEDLKADKADMYNEIVSLTAKVAEMTEHEKAVESEAAKQLIPTGYPIKGYAITVQDPTVETGAKIKGRLVYHVMDGSAIVAAANGSVTMKAFDPDFGTVVMIDHGNGYQSVYRSDGSAKVKLYDAVSRNETLFVVTEDESIFAYELVYNGEAVEPMDIMEIPE